MTDPSAASAAAAIGVTATGMTVLGVSTGLHPELLLAGITGALWALSYADPMPVWRRLAITCVTALVAGYLTPIAEALLRINSLFPEAIASEVVSPPLAVVLGFVAYRVIGPAILRLAERLTKGPPA